MPLIIMGDINVDTINPDRKTTAVNELLASHNIERIKLPPTRITHHSATSIDWICTNISHKDLKNKVIKTGLSDHRAQTCTILTETPTPTPILNRSLKTHNLQDLKHLLEGETWEEVTEAATSEEAYNNFNKIITLALESACPKKVRKHKKKSKPKQFADAEALNLKKDFLTMQCRYESTGNVRDKEQANHLKKMYDQRLKVLRKQASIKYIDNAENKTKAMWDLINSARNNKTSTQNQLTLNINNQSVSNPQKIANHFNTYFTSIAEITLQKIPPSERKQPTLINKQINHTLSMIYPTSEEEIEDIIMNLKPKNSSGIDEISSKIIKFCKDPLLTPLASIYNQSFREGSFPSALKLCKVYPKFKGGCPKEPSNYRPISLISTFSKVCEKIVLKRILNHCAQNNLLTDCQHGFRKGKSTTTAIIKLIETVIDDIEDGNLSTAIFLDFSKAFDCLSQTLIIQKLEYLGIKHTAKKWFESYLKERRQLVQLRNTDKGVTTEIKSNLLRMERGVPQGSVLGPVMFILFTNDLPENLGDLCTPLMYADDTTLLLNSRTPDNLAVSSYVTLNMAYQYCHRNDLVVNVTKTSQLAFGRRAKDVQSIPGVDMEDQAKFLGIMLDEAISWTPHLDNLCKKLSTSLYVIKQINSISNTNTAKIAYSSLFEPHIRYGIAVWGASSKTNLQRILLLQKKAVRALAGLQSRESCREAFKSLRILTVVSLYIQEVVVYTDGEDLPRNSNLHRYNTRNNHLYGLPTHHLSLYEKKPTYNGRKFFNHLPPDLQAKTGRHLKTALNEWLLRRPFYCIEEFLQKEEF